MKESYITMKEVEQYFKQSEHIESLDGLSEKEKKALMLTCRDLINKQLEFSGIDVLQQIKYGLGIDEIPENIDEDTDLPIFDEINKLYMEAFKGCYFCDPWADPNAKIIEIDPICQMKIVRFLTVSGVDTSKIPVLADVPVLEQRHEATIKKISKK